MNNWLQTTTSGRTELYFGQRKSGKTWLLFSRLTDQFFENGGKIKPNNKYFVLIQPSYENNTAYEQWSHIKKLFQGKQGEVHTSYNRQLSQELSLLIDKKNEKGKQVIIIIDDVGGDSFIKFGGTKTNLVEYLAKQASHYPTIVICLFQRAVQASNTLRDQADAIHMFYTKVKNELDLYHKTYFSNLDWREFMDMWQQIFKDPFDYLTVVNLPGGQQAMFKNDQEIDPSSFQK